MKRIDYFLLFVIFVVMFASAWYGIKSNYSLSGDLPALVASLNSFGNFSNSPSSPYLLEGKPDIHNGYYLFSLAVLKETFIFSPHINYFFTNHASDSIFLLFIFGLLTAILLPLSFFIMAKELFEDRRKAIFATLALFLLAEIPLIRWAGIISFHGMMSGSLYPQSFSFIFFFLTIFGYLRFRKLSSINYAFLTLLFFVLTFLIHMLTGLILFYLLLNLVSLDYFKYYKKEILLLLFLLITTFFIAHLWPFFPMYEFISLSIPYFLIIFLIPTVILSSFILNYFYKKFKREYDEIKFVKIGSSIGLLLFMYVIVQFLNNKVNEYSYAAQIDIWVYSFIFLFTFSLFLVLPFIFNRKDNVKFWIFIWLLSTILVYLLGLTNVFTVKVFWRFLLFAKIPAALVAGYYLANSKKIFSKAVIIFIFVVIVSLSLTLVTVHVSTTSKYFKEVPPLYSIQSEVEKLFNDSLILSDPETSYHIASFTNNRVLAVTSTRVSDYDYEINNHGLLTIFRLINQPNCLELEGLSIKGVVFNKNLIYDSYLETRFTQTPLNYNSNVHSFKKCDYAEVYEDHNFIILVKNETST